MSGVLRERQGGPWARGVRQLEERGPERWWAMQPEHHGSSGAEATTRARRELLVRSDVVGVQITFTRVNLRPKDSVK